jgi:voltage-gated potassium channel
MVFGTVGFSVIEVYGFIQAFYMTVIVISKVGLSSVTEISDETKMFIAILIIINVGLFAYGTTVVTEYITERDLRNYLKYRKVKKQIVNLKNHVIICGYGRNG